MKLLQTLRTIGLAALVSAAPLSAQAAPTLTVCLDSATNGFNYGTATCVTDDGAGDLLDGDVGEIFARFSIGSIRIRSTTMGEPVFDPGFGLLFSNDASSVVGSWIVAVAQTNLYFGNAVPSGTYVSTSFTGSVVGAGSASYSVFVDDDNRGLNSWGPVGTPIASGGFGSGLGTVTMADPFSMLAFVTLNGGSGAGSTFSTDLTITVPEPASLALIGSALLGLSLVSRRRRIGR